MQQSVQGFSDREGVPEYVRGIRALEERYSNIVRRVQLNEQGVLSSGKKAHSELVAINSEIADMKKQLDALVEKIAIIARELQTLARKEDVDVLKKYLNLWEPVNFVTQGEVERIVRRVLDDQGSEKQKPQ
ncbi:hypothetical protein HYV82_02690 [Candidatus Woesearchaeota archaeon]|nr:hypothetical protein [Candidatus Woesearchaeota archaeon]